MVIIACLPAYNEEEKIVDSVKKSLEFVDKVIVCDDCSTDKTKELAEKAGAIVIQHQKNTGYGGAIKSLFQYAKQIGADVMVTIDADGQHLPEEIPNLVNALDEKSADLIIGNRFDKNIKMPIYRKFGIKVINKVTNLASDLPFKDTQSGFRAYSKKAIQSIKFSSNIMGAASEILVNASNKGLKILEEPITVIYDTGAKTSSQNPITHSTSIITTIIELIAIRQPLRYLGIPGFILMIIGIIYSIVVVIIFNDTRYFSVPSTLVALGSLVIGLMLLMMSAVLYSISHGNRYYKTHMD